MVTNNFNLIRLAAAWLVLFSHSFPLTGSPEPFGIFFGYLSGGGLAVDVFFLISGYLITQSAAHRSLLDFCVARALRILPALFFAVVFCILIGATFTTLSQAEYWSHPATWDYLRNAYLFPIRFPLPGVFDNNPVGGPNGSLWTLPIEATMYIISACLLVLAIRSWKAFLALTVAFGVCYFVSQWQFGLSWANKGGNILPGVPLFNFLGMGYFFFAGAVLLKLAPTASWAGVGFAGLAFIASAWMPRHAGEVVYFLTLPYLVYAVAFIGRSSPKRRAGERADLSYGIYLYAFPVQQCIVHVWGADIGPLWLAALATPPTVFLAAASWRVIERPALNLKRKPAAVVAVAVQPSSSWT